MFVSSPVSPLCSPLSVNDVDIWGFQVVGIRKLVCRFKVGVPALCLSCRCCLSWHNTLFTNFHTVRCLVLCDFQKSGMRIRPCLRFLTAVELLIKRLMIKLSKRDSWAELLPMSDRGHALPSQPRTLPQQRADRAWTPCQDCRGGAARGGSCHSLVVPVFSLLPRFRSRSEQTGTVTLPLQNNCQVS